MKSPKSFGLRKKLPKLIFFRRVAGASMLPSLAPGKIVIATSLVRPKVGRIVVIQHGGLEKIKRVTKARSSELFVEGDNKASSTDSRQFGWLPKNLVIGVIIKPKWSRRG